MKLLLETHLLLWAAEQPDRLSPVARNLIADPSNTPMSSSASLWEIGIKFALGRDNSDSDPGRCGVICSTMVTPKYR